ncbi:MAG TPA: hypothetical protein DCW90_02230 [Lachnospiraceae bacterium]|nr:bifunctional adenosylcobinamide kinase/adenosylcobinamide-phosphate guanylyltransferase [uncultured Lachnoclostridium sp.]HAU84353.1 hypothetical protein [Lachnospiraceae bacterium]
MKKILVIGGACQGKTEWVQLTFPEYRNISVEDLLTENREGRQKSLVCLNHFHHCMRQWIKQGKNYEKDLNFIISNPSWLIVADEIGNGIVPIDKLERKWREETGRALCKIAKEADVVYRIYCGIPEKIKEVL